MSRAFVWRAHSTNKFLVNSFATQAKSASSEMMEIMAFLLSPFSRYFNIPSESAGMNQAEINTQTNEWKWARCIVLIKQENVHAWWTVKSLELVQSAEAVSARIIKQDQE